jgi:hypothetical protein
MHLKQGGNRHAHLMYGIEVNKFFEDEIGRSYKIHYHFQLYEDDQVVGDAIEGTFENTSPKLTKRDYCYDNYGRACPYRMQGPFEFVPYTFCTPSVTDD